MSDASTETGAAAAPAQQGRPFGDIQQDVFRACGKCAGSVHSLEGRVACALKPPVDCVLPRGLSALQDALIAGDTDTANATAALMTPEWIARRIADTGPIKETATARKASEAAAAAQTPVQGDTPPAA